MKKTHGGKRKNAGRKLKYGEKTQFIALKCPASKVEAVRKLVREYLKKFIVNE